MSSSDYVYCSAYDEGDRAACSRNKCRPRLRYFRNGERINPKEYHKENRILYTCTNHGSSNPGFVFKDWVECCQKCQDDIKTSEKQHVKKIVILKCEKCRCIFHDYCVQELTSCPNIECNHSGSLLGNSGWYKEYTWQELENQESRNKKEGISTPKKRCNGSRSGETTSSQRGFSKGDFVAVLYQDGYNWACQVKRKSETTCLVKFLGSGSTWNCGYYKIKKASEHDFEREIEYARTNKDMKECLEAFRKELVSENIDHRSFPNNDSPIPKPKKRKRDEDKETTSGRKRKKTEKVRPPQNPPKKLRAYTRKWKRNHVKLKKIRTKFSPVRDIGSNQVVPPPPPYLGSPQKDIVPPPPPQVEQAERNLEEDPPPPAAGTIGEESITLEKSVEEEEEAETPVDESTETTPDDEEEEKPVEKDTETTPDDEEAEIAVYENTETPVDKEAEIIVDEEAGKSEKRKKKKKKASPEKSLLNTEMERENNDEDQDDEHESEELKNGREKNEEDEEEEDEVEKEEPDVLEKTDVLEPEEQDQEQEEQEGEGHARHELGNPGTPSRILFNVPNPPSPPTTITDNNVPEEQEQEQEHQEEEEGDDEEDGLIDKDEDEDDEEGEEGDDDEEDVGNTFPQQQQQQHDEDEDEEEVAFKECSVEVDESTFEETKNELAHCLEVSPHDKENVNGAIRLCRVIRSWKLKMPQNQDLHQFLSDLHEKFDGKVHPRSLQAVREAYGKIRRILLKERERRLREEIGKGVRISSIAAKPEIFDETICKEFEQFRTQNGYRDYALKLLATKFIRNFDEIQDEKLKRKNIFERAKLCLEMAERIEEDLLMKECGGKIENTMYYFNKVSKIASYASKLVNGLFDKSIEIEKLVKPDFEERYTWARN